MWLGNFVPEIDRVELHDRSRTTADRSIDSTFDSFLNSTRLWSTAIDLIDVLVGSLALLPVAWIVCVACELVKPFRGRVFMYRCSRLTLAISLTISEIFSVKEWCHLENQVRGRSRSLKMAPFNFNRPCATLYWSAIVNIVLTCTIFEFFWMLNNIATLKSGNRSLNVIETGAIRKLGCGFLFAFYSNYGRICSHLWDV